jgi:hypothetical protein
MAPPDRLPQALRRLHRAINPRSKVFSPEDGTPLLQLPPLLQ